jgi:hypothetical protein
MTVCINFDDGTSKRVKFGDDESPVVAVAEVLYALEDLLASWRLEPEGENKSE